MDTVSSEVSTKYVVQINRLSANPTKWSDALKQSIEMVNLKYFVEILTENFP